MISIILTRSDSFVLITVTTIIIGLYHLVHTKQDLWPTINGGMTQKSFGSQ